jgi:hypothetical protein
MVKTRIYGDAYLVNKHYLNMISRMGTSYTYTTTTDTLDSLGNMVSSSNVSTTVYGVFQVNLKEFIKGEVGLEGKGIAKFYGRASDNLDTDGLLTIDSKRWVLYKKVEDDEWSGVEVASVWYIILADG